MGANIAFVRRMRFHVDKCEQFASVTVVPTRGHGSPTDASFPGRSMLLRRWVIAGLIACLVPAAAPAEESRPRSMLVLDDANVRSPFYYEVFSRLRAVVNASAGPPVDLSIRVADQA